MNFPKNYNDYSSYIRKIFPGRTQKISIDAGFTCPNRDGTKSYAGCTYCNNNSFKPEYCKPVKSVTDQIEEGISFFTKRRLPDQFLAYFQSYSNTYAPVDQLEKIYTEALCIPEVRGLVISTRPDCLDKEKIDLLAKLAYKCYLSLEIGVESCKNETLQGLNRCHTFEDAQEAFELCKGKGFDLGAHIILGLPGEDYETIISHAGSLSQLPIKTLKIHQLQIICKTVMAYQYSKKPSSFNFLSLEDYIQLIVDFLERLNPEIVIERFASQSPRELLIYPKWGLKNFEITRLIEKELKVRETWQGKNFQSVNSSFLKVAKVNQ